MNKHQKFLTGFGLVAAVALAACSSDDDTPAPPSGAVPDSAAASTGAFVTYLEALNPSDETSEPLTIGDAFAVPPDETSEPAPLS